MKRFVAVICMVVCVAVLSACGGSNGTSATTIYERPTTVVSKPSTLTLLGGCLQGGTPFAAFSNVSTVAGTAGAFGHADLVSTSASFYQPNGITTDGPNLYIADYKNHIIRMIVKATGQVSTLAGVAGVPGADNTVDGTPTFYFPNAITTDGQYLYVTDANFAIRKILIAAPNTVSVLAGQTGTPGSIDETGTAARFNQLNGITTDGTYLYLTDSNNTIRWIHKDTGVARTLAGTAGSLGSRDGAPRDAQFNNPARITCDGRNLYVCDFFNRTVRKVDIATGVVSKLAGTAGSLASIFNQPNGITTDGTNLFVTDTFKSTISKIVIADGSVTKIAGVVDTYGKTDGSTASALFHYPVGITTDGASLYVTDSENHTIRRIY